MIPYMNNGNMRLMPQPQFFGQPLKSSRSHESLVGYSGVNHICDLSKLKFLKFDFIALEDFYYYIFVFEAREGEIVLFLKSVRENRVKKIFFLIFFIHF